VAFTRLLLEMRKFFLKLPKDTQWWHPIVGGVTVGLMGWFVPQVLGVGYGYVGNALNGTMALTLMLLLVLLKLFGVTISYASGNAGESLARAYFSEQCWRRHRHCGPRFAARIHRTPVHSGRLRAGRNGCAFRGYRASPYDISADDL
jgi:voltage-gated chloride channel